MRSHQTIDTQGSFMNTLISFFFLCSKGSNLSENTQRAMYLCIKKKLRLVLQHGPSGHMHTVQLGDYTNKKNNQS
jgi:hypothetical protein